MRLILTAFSINEQVKNTLNSIFGNIQMKDLSIKLVSIHLDKAAPELGFGFGKYNSIYNWSLTLDNQEAPIATRYIATFIKYVKDFDVNLQS
jgi:hypothetical protein